MGDCPIARSAGVSRQGEKLIPARLLPSAGHRRQRSLSRLTRALEPTALRAAAQRPEPFDAMGGLTGDRRPSDSMSSRTLFTAMLLLATVAGGVAVDAQTAKMPTVAYLSVSTQAVAAPNVAAFRQGLRELGYVEGKSIALAVRYGEARSERLPELARELQGLKVAVIVTANDVATAAAKREAPATSI